MLMKQPKKNLFKKTVFCSKLFYDIKYKNMIKIYSILISNMSYFSCRSMYETTQNSHNLKILNFKKIIENLIVHVYVS
jgi:hypothetical protein